MIFSNVHGLTKLPRGTRHRLSREDPFARPLQEVSELRTRRLTKRTPPETGWEEMTNSDYRLGPPR
jgi:hypothetical protein